MTLPGAGATPFTPAAALTRAARVGKPYAFWVFAGASFFEAGWLLWVSAPWTLIPLGAFVAAGAVLDGLGRRKGLRG